VNVDVDLFQSYPHQELEDGLNYLLSRQRGHMLKDLASDQKVPDSLAGQLEPLLTYYRVSTFLLELISYIPRRYRRTYFQRGSALERGDSNPPAVLAKLARSHSSLFMNWLVGMQQEQCAKRKVAVTDLGLRPPLRAAPAGPSLQLGC
jgi:hypothetical protein